LSTATALLPCSCPGPTGESRRSSGASRDGLVIFRRQTVRETRHRRHAFV
jgi:hypothetical protein